MSSCEHSEHYTSKDTQFNWTTNIDECLCFDKATAITIKLNTAPWKQGGIANEETYCEMLNKIREQVNGVIYHPIAWELDKNCQLHCHATIFSNFTVYRNKAINSCKNVKDNHSVFIKEIQNSREVHYWIQYCKKSQDMRRMYYDNIAYTYQSDTRQVDMLTLQSDMADSFIELDSKYWHWRYNDQQCYFVDEL